MTNFLYDLRYAVRHGRELPVFAITAILTLALAIGANTAIFSVVNASMLRPLPYLTPANNCALGSRITTRRTKVRGKCLLSTARCMKWRATKRRKSRCRLFLSSGSEPPGGLCRSICDWPTRVAKYFDVLGTPPLLGRGFTKDDDLQNGPNDAVLSNDLWRTAFHSDPHIIGHSIFVKGAPYTVVGVLAPASTPHRRTFLAWEQPSPLNCGHLCAPAAPEKAREPIRCPAAPEFRQHLGTGKCPTGPLDANSHEEQNVRHSRPAWAYAGHCAAAERD